MRKTMIIPTYWCRRTGELWREGDAVYDLYLIHLSEPTRPAEMSHAHF